MLLSKKCAGFSLVESHSRFRLQFYRREAPVFTQNMSFFGRIQVCPANSKSFGPVGLRGSMCVTVPDFVKIGQTVAEIRRFSGLYCAMSHASAVCHV